MDDPGWTWPAWKFGMKREALFTSLHDQYNTFPSTIQDPEAFHHDVYELSNSASTLDEFHQLLADRKEQRLRELNDGLESASLEIIANPKLIGTQQWQYALQLFRTKSLDSLVRYFASYLPDDHPWNHSQEDAQTFSTATTSVSDSIADSVESTSTSSSKPFFDDDDHEYLSHEPLTIHTSIPASHLPPSPRSLTACTDSSFASPIDSEHHDFALNPMTPARTLSFSDNGSDVMIHSEMLSRYDEDDTSQQDDADTPFSSISDISDSDAERHQFEERNEAIATAMFEGRVEEVEESVNLETSTPHDEVVGGVASEDDEHDVSSSKAAMSVHRPSSSLYNQVLHEYVRSSRKGRREASPARCVRRTSPEIGRVQKPLPDSIRIRPKGRRRNE